MTETLLHLDVETVAVLDLNKTGAYRYAQDKDTDCIMAFCAFGETGKVRGWLPSMPVPDEIIAHVQAGGKVAAWNAQFERLIWKYVLGPKHNWPDIKPEQFVCTMAQAAYWGLPLSLDMASDALGGPPKDKEGHSLMLRMSRPRKTNKDGTHEWWHLDDPQRYARLQDYCAQDVEAERGICYQIPPLPPEEVKVYQVDQRLNDRGVFLDQDLVTAMSRYADASKKKLDARMAQITDGEVTTCSQVGKLLDFVRKSYPGVNSLDKANMAKALKSPHLTGAARRAVELRQIAAKSSTAKLTAMLNCVGEGSRVRGMLQYYGAFRTGRHAGRLIQPQNMPRGEIKDVDRAISWMLRGVDADMIELTFGPVMSVVSSCLRGCLAAPNNMSLTVVDFSQIEARVLAWEADQQDILNVFANGEGVYVYDATQIGSDNRALGKVCRLGLGYGMGANKFVETALGYGLTLETEFAAEVVSGWRKANPYIVGFWYDCQEAAIKAIESKRNALRPKIYNVGKVDYAMMGSNLVCRLPSGRYLVYREAQIEHDEKNRPRVTYMGVNQYTRKWERQDTWGGKLVENITQAIARDLMIAALLRLDKAGYRILLTVHDELIVETDADIDHLKNIKDIIRINPAWADGLPTDCEGWVGTRYRK